ncbi:MAG: DNA repair protein RecN [Ignavibacteriaceae bacterium]
MLKSLKIQDYALIKSIYVEFGKGLNIITGETGAGKSILIDAINLLIGERASTETVREGAQKAFVEGIFDIASNKKIEELLGENQIEILPELILRREISLKGANRCFINDTPAPLSVVKDLGDILVDFHGQHEHQALLKPDTHIDYLDEFSHSEDLLRNYRWLYSALIKLKKDLAEMKGKTNSNNEKRDIYLFQLKEIDAVSPEPDEEEKLVEELKILENSEQLLELTTNIYQGLYESENAVYDSLVKIRNMLNEAASIDKSFTESNKEYESVVAMVKDISEFIRSYNSRIEMDSGRLNTIRERLSAINLLKKKYGGSIKAVLDHRKKIREELGDSEDSSEKITELEKKIITVSKNCAEAAEKLYKNRRDGGKEMEEEVKDILKYLGVTNAGFNVKITHEKAEDDDNDVLIVRDKPYKYNSKGYDKVEFFISTNKGETPKPLAKVASGGEVSRVMLTLKTILARSDRTPVLIFDEIDTGVSGPIAQKVGEAMRALTNYHQVIAITHLPQIAGMANHHFLVEKLAENDRVVSSIRKLSNERRILEIAKLMSGEMITEASIKGAKELIRL